jgi:opacity protein-like surface antigen
MRKVFVTAFVVLMAAAPAVAQEDRPVGFNFGGGWAFPLAGFNDSFDTGWNGGIGVTFNVTPELGVQAEYMYDRMGGPDRQLALYPTPVEGDSDTFGTIESNHQMHTGTFNLVYTPRFQEAADRPFGGYVLGGGGIYHRLIQLTTPSVGYTSVCDPYWYVCYPTLVSVDRIIGDRSSNDFGINVGGGLTFGREAKFYIEMRYHYVWGPTIRPEVQPVDGSPTEYSTDAQYFPLTFGVRW